jgi:hypothetical protein
MEIMEGPYFVNLYMGGVPRSGGDRWVTLSGFLPC